MSGAILSKEEMNAVLRTIVDEESKAEREEAEAEIKTEITDAMKPLTEAIQDLQEAKQAEIQSKVEVQNAALNSLSRNPLTKETPHEFRQRLEADEKLLSEAFGWSAKSFADNRGRAF